MGLWNGGILPQHYMTSQSGRPRLECISKPQSLHPEDGGSMDFETLALLPLHHTASESRRPRLQ
jgi:hypothetical protein